MESVNGLSFINFNTAVDSAQISFLFKVLAFDLRRTFHFETRIAPGVRNFLGIFFQSAHAHRYAAIR